MTLLPFPTDPATKPPAGLSTGGRALWTKLVAEYEFTDAVHFALLEQVVRSYDGAERARLAIAKRGDIIETSAGPKANPACASEVSYRRTMLSALRMLGLHLEPVRADIGRPPGR